MASLLAPGTVLHGRYTIVQVLRAGAEAAIYLAEDAAGAVEQVEIMERFDASPEAQSAFLKEAALLAKLEHPSLPVVIDHFIEPSGQQYLVMEHVEGTSLAQLLEQRGALREADVLGWFDRLLAAVEYLHAQRPAIIHGRISPASIVIGTDGIPRLLDLCAEVAEIEAGAAAPEENPYLAPEMVSGNADERVDIYALGATLYTLLTGQRPTSAPARSGGQSLPSPRSLNKSLSTVADGAIVRAMALDPQERFASPAELWRALQKPPKPRRRRNLAGVLGVALGLVLLLVAVAALAQFLPAVLSRAYHDYQAIRRRVVFVTATPPARDIPPTAVPLIATVTPSASLASTLTSTATATATPVPTVTVTASPVSAEATRAVTAMPAATAGPAPRVLRPPALLAPADGAALTGPVEFRWYWPETLQTDEYFDVQVWRSGEQPAGIAWSKETCLRVESLAGGGSYRWRVQVIRGRDGQLLATLSEPSWEQAFTWKP